MAGWLRTGLATMAFTLMGTAWAQSPPEAPADPEAQPAEQAPPLFDGTDPGHAIRLLQQEGYRAKLIPYDDSGPSIESGAVGSSFWLHFEACNPDGERCEVVIFSAGFDVENPIDPALIAEWNRTRFTKAFLDDEGDPYVDFVVNVRYGVTEKNFIDTLNWFITEFSDFIDMIGWKGDPGEVPQVPGTRERLNGPI